MSDRDKKRCTAIVLAAGSGSRMNSPVAKQYMLLGGKPLIWYTLMTLEVSQIVDDCILVTPAEDVEYVKREIVRMYGFSKVDVITAGGAERYLSVQKALEVIKNGRLKVPNKDGYVFIHDGARPLLTEDILQRTYQAVQEFHACVAAVPVKDTIKVASEDGFVVNTPDRKTLWSIQTPQVFDTEIILQAYDALQNHINSVGDRNVAVTDDAEVVERFLDWKVKLVEGAYRNLKITTPEDIVIAKALL